MTPMTNKVKLWGHFEGVTKEVNSFAFEGEVIIGLKNTHPDGYVAKIGLNDPKD